ncbi:MAG TPA: hypothetical protein VGQ41_24410 [Pyrinomonadaceae bacterium]|jgi:hypothetical protein|nr:hypothetical protein [Pyrinomonadaceae bacterium]
MSVRKEWKTLLLWVVPLFVIGIGAIVAAPFTDKDSLFHHLMRDIGIALLISALVTVAYEAYARRTFDLAKIETLLDTVYGSGVPPDIWDSIKDRLLNRRVIRRNTNLHLSVLRSQTIANDEVVLGIDFAYELGNLVNKDASYEIVHGLDEHIATAQLPRFVEASIGTHSETVGGDPWESTGGDISVKDGRLTMMVQLRPSRENVLVPIRLTREEFRTCPGSYYLIMSEITEGIKIYLDECPKDVDVTLFLYPTSQEVSLTEKHLAIIEEPLLLGHCLDFKLTPRTIPSPGTRPSPNPLSSSENLTADAPPNAR